MALIVLTDREAEDVPGEEDDELSSAFHRSDRRARRHDLVSMMRGGRR